MRIAKVDPVRMGSAKETPIKRPMLTLQPEKDAVVMPATGEPAGAVLLKAATELSTSIASLADRQAAFAKGMAVLPAGIRCASIYPPW